MPANNSFGYHVFRSRVKLEGTLTLLSGLHIGKGRALDPVASDLPVLKDRNGNPFIPGSSLKGVLRSNLEAWLRAFFPVNWWQFACDRTIRESDKHCVSNERKQEIVRQHRQSASEADRLLWEESCWICRFFGSPWLASKVQMVDLQVKNPWQPEWLMIRDGVVIDRESETAATGFLYDFEAVPAGTRFALEMLVENPEPYEMGLLVVGFDLLNDGYALLGGDTSRGLGRVEIDIDDICILTPVKLLERLRPQEPAPSKQPTVLGQSTDVSSPIPSPTESAGDDPDDPLEAIVACLREMGTADHQALVGTMQQKGWTKQRLQQAFPQIKDFNWKQLFERALKAGKVVMERGRFSLPAAQGAKADSPLIAQQVAEQEKVMEPKDQKQKEIERLIRDWKEALRREIQKALEGATCSESSTTKPNS